MRSLQETVQRLCEISRRKAVDPYTYLDWPDSLDPGQWFTSPELISLYGTPRWERMDDEARARLSFLEAVNFCSINIHGEKTLIEGLAQRLYATTDGAWEASSPYLHHFIDEENKHLVYFGGFCRRSTSRASMFRAKKTSCSSPECWCSRSWSTSTTSAWRTTSASRRSRGRSTRSIIRRRRATSPLSVPWSSTW